MFFQRHFAQLEYRAASGIVDQFRKALDKPPAPTSWMEIIGFWSPSCQQRSMTSCARRSISGLPRCTELKSKDASFVPVSIEEAAPPPKPMSMPGTAQLDQQCAFGDFVFVRLLRLNAAQTAGNHNRFVVAANLTVKFFFKGAEVAQEVQVLNSLLNAAPPIGLQS